jgi:Putative DNA-binding domain
MWQQIKPWIETGIETTKVELKREFPLNDRTARAKFAKLVTAIANSPGGTGYFIIGVIDNQDRISNSLDEIIVGVSGDFDSYQKQIQQALTEFTNPVPSVKYEEILVPETEKIIGIVVIERSRQKPHEITRESDSVKPGTYIRRGAETFTAGREDLRHMMGPTDNHTIIVNFTHPMTDAQLSQISQSTGCYISEVVQPLKVPVHFDENFSFEAQVVQMVDEVGLTSEQWQELKILINVPGYASIAVALIAEIHGRMGHFPNVIRFKRSSDDSTRYEFEEYIQLQRIRDKARAQRY